MAATVRVYAPLVNTYAPPKKRPPRPESLKGLRPGVLENSKYNAQLLMESMVLGLTETFGLKPVTIGHKGVQLPPSKETIELLRDNCDFVLVGTADCGSCAAWTVRSAVILEEHGIPTVGVGSDVFEELFRQEAEQLGMRGLEFVYVEHPLGGLREGAVRVKAKTTLDKLESAILGRL